MFKKFLPIVAALAVATPASAITVNVSDFFFGSPADVTMNNALVHDQTNYSGAAGAFMGSFADSSLASSARQSTLAAAAAPTSFIAWCVDLFQTFNFNTPYTDYSLVSPTSLFGAQKSDALSRLFTAAQGFAVDNQTSAALQAGIWEILYESGTGYGFKSGTYTGSAEDASGQAAFDQVDFYLTHLGMYGADASIEILHSDNEQDFLVATIPEPETWMLFGLGLGALGVLRRRARAKA